MSRFGACILSSDGPRLTENEKALFREVRPFGFILFARHIESADQVRALCDELRAAAGHEALITVDQEGGRVQRFTAPSWRAWHPAMAHVEMASSPERAMYLRYRLIASELHACGLDSNCAPNLDIAEPDTHPFLKNRCYGDDPAQVSQIGRAVAQAHLDGGVLPIMKHMPGHGRAQQDSHKALPGVDLPLDVLRRHDFAPFSALADLPLAMTAHVVMPQIDAAPATQSAPVIKIIRDEIGFDGVLMTDDISMGALMGTLAQRAEASLAAGCDVVLHCNDDFAARCEIAQACGVMTQAGQRRADAALASRHTPTEIDIPALEAELEALLSGPVYV